MAVSGERDSWITSPQQGGWPSLGWPSANTTEYVAFWGRRWWPYWAGITGHSAAECQIRRHESGNARRTRHRNRLSQTLKGAITHNRTATGCAGRDTTEMFAMHR